MNRMHLVAMGTVMVIASLQIGCGTTLPTDQPSSDEGTLETDPLDDEGGTTLPTDQPSSDEGTLGTYPLNDEGRPVGWTEETHGNDATPDYGMVFAQNEVKRLDITITPQDWLAMQEDMTALYGEFGQGSGGAQPPPDVNGGDPGPPPPLPGEGQGDLPLQPDGGQDEFSGPPDGGPGGGVRGELEETPTWVPCTGECDGRTWW